MDQYNQYSGLSPIGISHPGLYIPDKKISKDIHYSQYKNSTRIVCHAGRRYPIVPVVHGLAFKDQEEAGNIIPDIYYQDDDNRPEQSIFLDEELEVEEENRSLDTSDSSVIKAVLKGRELRLSASNATEVVYESYVQFELIEKTRS